MHFKRNKVRMIGLAAAAAVMLSGCSQIKSAAIEAGLMDNPYYEEGDTQWDHGGVEEYYFNQLPSEYNALYRELYSRISNYEDTAELYSHMSVEAFDRAYNAVLADHPEFFWLEPTMQIMTSRLTNEAVGYVLDTNTPVEERDAVKAQLEAAADEVISSIPEGASDYEKIKAVYEYVIDVTDYDLESENNQNIQSVLIGHASVCAGYTKTFQYILHRMGMFCTSVNGSITDRGDHAWNIVRIGDQYYNVDTTWGDPVFVGENEGDIDGDTGERAGADGAENKAAGAMNYNYLCCTDAELADTHTAKATVALPACTDGSLNYYRLNGLYYETFDWGTIENVLMNSVYNGDASCVMKFGSQEAYEQAKTEIFDGGLISEPTSYLMQQSGSSSWSYSYHADDAFRLITIYW